MMSRAVTGHAASIGISGALSFAAPSCWRRPSAGGSAFARRRRARASPGSIVVVAVPRRANRRLRPRTARRHCSISGRCCAIGRRWPTRIAYCVHTLEMNALRGWGVAFLGYVAASTGGSRRVLSPTFRADRTRTGRHAASVLGNEAAIRFGRKRLVCRPPWIHRRGGEHRQRRNDFIFAGRRTAHALRLRVSGSIPRRSRPARRALRNRPGAARRSRCIRRSAMWAVSSVRS